MRDVPVSPAGACFAARTNIDSFTAKFAATDGL